MYGFSVPCQRTSRRRAIRRNAWSKLPIFPNESRARFSIAIALTSGVAFC